MGLDGMSKPIAEDDYDMMVKICSTALNSKVISGHSNTLTPMAVSTVQSVTVPGTTYCDLDDIKVIKCYGGTIDDSERVNGIVFPKKASHFAGANSDRKCQDWFDTVLHIPTQDRHGEQRSGF